MSDTKTEILHEFDELIEELEVFVDEISAFPSNRTAWDFGVSSGDVPSDYVRKFYQIRTRFLVLLNKIDSNDTSLQSAIDHLRSVEFHEFNIRNILKNMQALRSDFEADILTKHPRLPEPVTGVIVEKQKWLDEPKAIVIAAIIGVIGVILAGLVATVINLNASLNNALVITYTPSPSVTIVITSTQSPTEEVTITP